MALDIQPDLNALRHALGTIHDDDASVLMPFIHHFDNFAPSDKSTARALLRNAFWRETQTPVHTYEFSNFFTLLTAQNLSTILQTIGDESIERFLFSEHSSSFLSHYPIDDLLDLLHCHYSDTFANFVFLQFKGFLNAELALRIHYFDLLSVKAIIEILKNGGVGKSLTNDELLMIIGKMKTYLVSNRQNIDITDNTWLDCQSILPEIIQMMMDHNLKSLSLRHLEKILENDLIINMDQSKKIIAELLQRQCKLHSNINSNTNTNNDENNMNIVPISDRLIGVLSTDNFACFQQSITHSDHVALNAHVTLDGPLVVMPRSPYDKEQDADPSRILNYSVLIQIQDLNPLFKSTQHRIQSQPSQPEGSIFVVLLQAIPTNYEVVLFVSNHLGRRKIKELNVGINNKNPICVIGWPLPQIGRIGRFRLHAQLRPIQADIKKIEFGIKHMFNSNHTERKSDIDQNMSSSTWSMRTRGNHTVMCIYSGARANTDRLSWINVRIDSEMTFKEMIDAAAAQLGLRTSTENARQVSAWSSSRFQPQESQLYVVRNQMGRECTMSQSVMTYLDGMRNSDLFAVFIFAKTSQPQRQQQTVAQNNASAFANLNFNSSTQHRNRNQGNLYSMF